MQFIACHAGFPGLSSMPRAVVVMASFLCRWAVQTGS
jgi:hypothetical protein